MFGFVVAVIALTVTGWYFWGTLKSRQCHSDDHSTCGHCHSCPTFRQSICNDWQQPEPLHEIGNPPNSENQPTQHEI
ncbi:MAG: hypothetical protein LBQ50_14800 [Planctomycetaceae bacterium]|nr:hypothetical protein [Planctomycetaceae bacterium]